MTFLVPALVLLAGLAVGSFLNVCIHRLPLGESIVRPGSRCPGCRTPVAPRDNVPLVSYALLRARCRHCRARISPRYVLVEALTGLLALGALWRFGLTPLALVAFVITAMLVVVVFTDLDHQIIPNEITYAAILLGLASLPVTMPHRWVNGLLGAGLGLLFLGGLAVLWPLLRKREGMGMGDVKLAVGLGAVLGVAGLMLTLFLASLAGTVVGLTGVALAGDKKEAFLTRLPFGVYLAPAAAAVLWIGPARILSLLPGWRGLVTP